MRFKTLLIVLFRILLIVSLFIVIGCLGLVLSNIQAQTAEITSLRERVHTLEWIVQHQVVGKAAPMEEEPDLKVRSEFSL